MYPWHSPYRMARGKAYQGPSVGNFSVIALYHNAPSDRLLCVLDIFMERALSQPATGGALQGKVGSSVGPVNVPLLVDEPAVSGQLTVESSAALPGGVDWRFGSTNAYGQVWPHDYPMVVLKPNWSFWMAPDTMNVEFGIGVVWSWCYPDELRVIPPPDLRDD